MSVQSDAKRSAIGIFVVFDVSSASELPDLSLYLNLCTIEVFNYGELVLKMLGNWNGCFGTP